MLKQCMHGWLVCKAVRPSLGWEVVVELAGVQLDQTGDVKAACSCVCPLMTNSGQQYM
jgi:hypothetical protein